MKMPVQVFLRKRRPDSMPFKLLLSGLLAALAAPVYQSRSTSFVDAEIMKRLFDSAIYANLAMLIDSHRIPLTQVDGG